MKAFEKKDHGALSSIDLKQPKYQLLYWGMFAFLILCMLVCVLPILWVVVSCFKDTKEFFQIPPTIIPHSFNPEYIKNVWSKMNVGRSYANTMIVACGQVAMSVVFNGIAGYVISRLKPKGSRVLFVMIVWTMMLPMSTSTVPMFATFMEFPIGKFSMMNTYWPLILPAGASAFNMLIFKSFFDGIDMSYIEAARVDGCTNLGIFARIVLPLSIPVVVAVAVFAFQGAWNDFIWPYLVLKDEALFTVPVQVFRMKTGSFLENEYIIMLMFSMIPSLIMFVLFQKQIMNGVSLGGVKG